MEIIQKKKDYKKGWQDGVEFGYNKAKEDARLKLKEYLLQEREIYWCKGFECGRKKQSEKLAEATKIIKELLDTQNRLDPYRDMFKDRVFKAEKFLKEVEK